MKVLTSTFRPVAVQHFSCCSMKMHNKQEFLSLKILKAHNCCFCTVVVELWWCRHEIKVKKIKNKQKNWINYSNIISSKKKVSFIFIFILFYLMLDKQKETRGVQRFSNYSSIIFSLPSRKNKLQKKLQTFLYVVTFWIKIKKNLIRFQFISIFQRCQR